MGPEASPRASAEEYLIKIAGHRNASVSHFSRHSGPDRRLVTAADAIRPSSWISFDTQPEGQRARQNSAPGRLIVGRRSHSAIELGRDPSRVLGATRFCARLDIHAVDRLGSIFAKIRRRCGGTPKPGTGWSARCPVSRRPALTAADGRSPDARRIGVGADAIQIAARTSRRRSLACVWRLGRGRGNQVIAPHRWSVRPRESGQRHGARPAAPRLRQETGAGMRAAEG